METRKINEYRIIMGDRIGELEEEVNKKIKEGFQPYGNMQALDRFRYFQAMVKYDNA